ncbi:hypothetical protein [Spirosoma sp.]|uniref:hypothetical protein n=1 Tax=Spirosoma sp. TaxID=1899569 RepID=UPI00260457EE|nr:hypothetical protein [Spirosoma sp.]MCX6215623.1 hypothetical protein [Spirosoma sp.]
MRLSFQNACLGALLSLMLAACQSPDQSQEVTPLTTPVVNRTDSYLFTGHPGIRTSSREDITGTITGTIDGQPIAFGPDKAFPVQARAGYNSRNLAASVLSVQVYSDQYNISLYLNGPIEAGRNYRIYNAAADSGEGKIDPYIATPFIRIPEGQSGRDIIDLTTPDEQVRITTITPDYIDIELLFTLSKPGAVPERITMRIKNIVDENSSVHNQSEGDPFWDYTNVDRMIEAWGYLPRSGNSPSSPTTTRVRINQSQLTTPVSDVSYGGKTEGFTGQLSSLYQAQQPAGQTFLECTLNTIWAATGWKQVGITWPAFRGVGSYTGDQVNLSFTNDQGSGGYWRIQTNRLASASTKWQVDVQRVTPDVIEGTYTVVDAPLLEKKGPMVLPTLVSITGRFKIIYPR